MSREAGGWGYRDKERRSVMKKTVEKEPAKVNLQLNFLKNYHGLRLSFFSSLFFLSCNKKNKSLPLLLSLLSIIWARRCHIWRACHFPVLTLQVVGIPLS